MTKHQATTDLLALILLASTIIGLLIIVGYYGSTDLLEKTLFNIAILAVIVLSGQGADGTVAKLAKRFLGS